MYEPIGTDKEGNEINLLDVIEHEQEDVTERMELCENTKKLFRLLNEVLTDRERDIIFMRYGLLTGKEITQREIGEYMDISRSYVSRIEKKVIERIRKELKKLEKPTIKGDNYTYNGDEQTAQLNNFIESIMLRVSFKPQKQRVISTP